MVIKEDIIMFYVTLRRYKDHDKVVELCINHYYPKVSDRMTVKDFSKRVNEIIKHALKAKKT